jgi:lysophospholipase L1-like esterase
MGYTDYNTFLMFGDSITEYAFNQFPGESKEPQFCLGAGLQQAYARKLQILQRGFSGYTSRDAVPLAKSILKTEHDDVSETKKIKIAYVFFGTNDARKNGKSSENRQSIPLHDYIFNMRSIVEEFLERNIPVIVIAPGLHSQELWDKNQPQDLITGDYRDNKTNKMYQDALVEAITDVPVIPLYDIMEKWLKTNSNNPDDYSTLLSDGIHYKGTGYRILYDAIIDAIETYYNKASPSTLPYRFPIYNELTDDTFKSIN